MAKICITKQTNEQNCKTCAFYKFDEDYQNYACFAKPNNVNEVSWAPKTKIQYELWRSEYELGYAHHVREYEIGDVVNKDSWPKLIDTFSSKEEALKALSVCRCDAWYTEGYDGTLLKGCEHYVTEAEYDEDDELIQSNIIEFAKMSEFTKAQKAKESQTFKILSVVEDTDFGGIRIEFLLINDIVCEEKHEIVAQLPKDDNGGYRTPFFSEKKDYKLYIDSEEYNILKSDFDDEFINDIVEEAVDEINS